MGTPAFPLCSIHERPYSPNLVELDFSHLRSKGVGYARHQSAQREVIDAYPTSHVDTDLLSVCATIFKARLPTRPGFARGSDPCTRQANHQFRPTCVGLGPTGAVPSLPSGLEPCHLVATKASRILLGALVQTFAPEGPLVVGIDETLERRRGRKIAAKGVYRDPVRSKPASASSRRSASDGSAWCFWGRIRGLLGFGLCRFCGRWPTQGVTPKSRASGTRN